MYTLIMRYIELIVLLNILIHFTFVRLTNFIMNKKNKYLLIIISILLDAIYVCLYLLLPERINSYKYIIVLALAIIPFLGNRITITLCLTLIYLMLNFILGGTSGIMIKIINHYIIVVVCLLVINLLVVIYIFIKNRNFSNRKLIFEVQIEFKGQKLILEGFFDTGNFLLTDNNIPVVFVKKQYHIGNYYKDILIQTVGSSYKISLYKIDSFKIKVNNKFIEKDVYIAYSNISYDVMFGSALL